MAIKIVSYSYNIEIIYVPSSPYLVESRTFYHFTLYLPLSNFSTFYGRVFFNSFALFSFYISSTIMSETYRSKPIEFVMNNNFLKIMIWSSQ